jgi:hypothetical protein
VCLCFKITTKKVVTKQKPASSGNNNKQATKINNAHGRVGQVDEEQRLRARGRGQSVAAEAQQRRRVHEVAESTDRWLTEKEDTRAQ